MWLLARWRRRSVSRSSRCRRRPRCCNDGSRCVPRAIPYFLYAASNAGSLVGLLVYPFVVEPRLTLADQRTLWAVGFLIVAALIAGCGIVSFRAQTRERIGTAETVDGEHGVTHERWGDRLRWLALCLCSVQPSPRRHHAHFDRCRGGTAAVGRPARDLPDDVHCRLCVATADLARIWMNRLAPTRDPRGSGTGDRPGRVVVRAGHPPRRLHGGRDCLSSRARRAASPSRQPHTVLSVGVDGWRTGRPVQRADRAGDLYAGRRVPAGT